MCGVRTYLNLSQLLPLLGNTVATSCTRSISGLYCCMQQIPRVRICVSGFFTDAGTVRIPGIKLGISSVGSCCEYSQYRNTLNMLSNTWSMKYIYFDRLCTVSTILRPIVRHKSLTDGPTSGSWSKLLSLGTTRILRALPLFREYVLRGVCTASTISISMLCLFYPAKNTFILREYILYVLDFTQPGTKYHVATSTSRNFLYLRLRRKHWIDRRVTSV